MHTQSHRQDPDPSPFYFFLPHVILLFLGPRLTLYFLFITLHDRESSRNDERRKRRRKKKEKLDLCFFRIVSEIAVLKCVCAGPVVGENLHKLSRRGGGK